MGRRRKLHRFPLTSIAVSVETLDHIQKLKLRRETYDHLIRRLLAEWQDLKDYRLDMDQVIRLKDKQISTLEAELRERQFQSSF